MYFGTVQIQCSEWDWVTTNGGQSFAQGPGPIKQSGYVHVPDHRVRLPVTQDTGCFFAPPGKGGLALVLKLCCNRSVICEAWNLSVFLCILGIVIPACWSSLSSVLRVKSLCLSPFLSVSVSPFASEEELIVGEICCDPMTQWESGPTGTVLTLLLLAVWTWASSLLLWASIVAYKIKGCISFRTTKP